MEPGGPNELEGPFFNTVGWEKDHNGVHPVEMLARIAKFEAKPEAAFQPYRKNLKNRADHDCRKVQLCKYDGFMVLGNGKLEKQAKLVSARNMICKIKTKNIGIVNETLAAGVTLETGVNPNPHKKPLSRQFKSFTSGGTLGNFQSAGALSGFVPASSSASAESAIDVVKPPVCSITDTDNLEIEQYQAYLEGKIETPSEKLPEKPSEEVDASTVTTAAPKIVFKRNIDTEQTKPISNSEEEPSCKKTKADNDIDNTKVEDNKFTEDSNESSWDSSNYGYKNDSQHQQSNWRGRGRGNRDWNNRGFNNRGWNNRGGFNNRGGYGNRGGFNHNTNGYYGYGYGYGGGWQ